jgi:Flp pilus assembly protein TadD
MIHSSVIRRGLAVLILCTVVAPVRAQLERESFKNLKVLPQDIAPEELRTIMGSFTRALGVRCTYCHVGEEGKPLRREDFQLDDKPTKLKARAMMKMTKAINDTFLAGLDSRSQPPVGVQCVTCHRGATQPRMLQDILKRAYDTGGMDSTLARYQALRDRYYGRFTYDFGEVPLSDLANQVRTSGHPDDAVKLLAYNVEMNPKSMFAKRQHAMVAISQEFQASADSGTATYRALKAEYGAPVVSEALMNEVGYNFLNAHQVDPALGVFKLNAADNPTSANAYDSMGEAYMQKSDWKSATQAYTKSLELDPTNENAKKKLDEIKVQSKAKPKKKK